jgi:hypothetical protein
MEDERKVWIKGGSATIEHRGAGSAGLDGDPEVVRYANSEFVRGPGVAPALDGLIV